MVDYMPQGTNITPAGAVEPGMYILPTFTGGVSPANVTIQIVASPGANDQTPGAIPQIVQEYAINFDDGTIVQGTFGTFVEGLAYASVTHTYTYAQGDTKYYGHTFYPDVTVKTAAGAIKTMNHDNQKACSVWVKDPAYTSDQN